MATDYVSDYEQVTGKSVPVETKVVAAPAKPAAAANTGAEVK